MYRVPKKESLSFKQKAGFAELLVLGMLCGIFLGLGVFTFLYARGGSYLTDDPEACANCHVMREEYSQWMKGSHRKAAVCNDCHAPQAFVPKYATKALNGFLHSWAFTAGLFSDQIRITRRNARVTDAACLKCHAAAVEAISAARAHGAQASCIRCHAGAGHGK
jgi:cytochrome c nitrite reductase small subunit